MKEAVLFEVLLDLQKAYDALDWEIRLEILVAYGVDPRTIRLLLDIQGPTDHGGQDRQIHWISVQRLPQRDPRQYPIPHALQRGRGLRPSFSNSLQT